MHFAPAPLHPAKEGAVEEFQNGLVLIGGHRQDLHHPVGKLDEVIGLVCQLQVLLYGPGTLKRQKV